MIQKSGTCHRAEACEATVNEMDRGISEDAHLVSVIIPTSNSERTLTGCLQSIKDQTYRRIETIVVDKHSHDNTASIAQNLNARFFLRDSERSAARNFGVKNANGSFVFFVDSDMELAPHVVQQCVAACLTKGAEAVIIPEESIAKGFLSECRRIEKKMRLGDQLFEAPRFFLRKAFQEVGGYDTSLTFGEDTDLYIRLRRACFKTCRVKSRILHDEGELSMKEAVRKAHLYGKSLPPFIKKNPSLAFEKHSPARILRLQIIKSLLNDPVHLAGLVFLKMLEYEAYLAGILTHFYGRNSRKRSSHTKTFSGKNSGDITSHTVASS